MMSCALGILVVVSVDIDVMSQKQFQSQEHQSNAVQVDRADNAACCNRKWVDDGK